MNDELRLIRQEYSQLVLFFKSAYQPNPEEIKIMLSVKPNRGCTKVPTGAKPDGFQLEPNSAPATPVKAVTNPLEAKPNELPNAKDAAAYYAFEKNEKARRRLEKQNR